MQGAEAARRYGKDAKAVREVDERIQSVRDDKAEADRWQRDAMLQRCNAATLQRCNAATLQRCNAATLQRIQRCNGEQLSIGARSIGATDRMH